MLTVFVRVAGPPGALLVAVVTSIVNLASVVVHVTTPTPEQVVVPKLSVTVTVRAAWAGTAVNPAKARAKRPINPFHRVFIRYIPPFYSLKDIPHWAIDWPLIKVHLSNEIHRSIDCR